MRENILSFGILSLRLGVWGLCRELGLWGVYVENWGYGDGVMLRCLDVDVEDLILGEVIRDNNVTLHPVGEFIKKTLVFI